MKNLLVAIVSEGLFSLVALLVILAIVWFGGDYLGYPASLRTIVCLAILGMWLLLYLVQRVLAVRRAMRIEAMLRAQAAASPVTDPRLGPIDALTHQFRLGVQALRATRTGKAAVQRMPWFLIMGPPGSGKTAAIRESGLNFPCVGLGHRALASAGATRTIDWWYADKAVFLDIAGGYVADPARHGEWLALVRLLARTKRDRAIDGVILVVSIAELLALAEDRIVDHAQNLRDRIDELASRLGMIFPVHLVFSHCDRLHGFSEFFAHFPLEQRGQAWGCTFEWRAAGPQGLGERVDEEFRHLYQVLGQRRIEALAAGATGEMPDEEQRNALLFPIQFSLLQRRVGQYIAALTRPNPFQESGYLRGFWFTSAVQGGDHIDRVLASIGLGDAVLKPVEVKEQRAYFLKGPFADIIPADQGLARLSARTVRRNRLASAAAAVIAGGAAAAAGLVVYSGYQDTEAILSGLVQDGSRLRNVEPTSNDGARIPNDLTDHLQRFAVREGIPWILYPGLADTGALAEKARTAYLRNSARPLIAGYAHHLAADMAKRLAASERSLALYEELDERFRVYLMLCGRIPFDREAVSRMFTGQNARRVDDPVAAAAHLKFILANFPSQEWIASADAALAERVTHELRDALWIPLTGVDIARAGATLYPAVDLNALLAAHSTTSLTLERSIPGFFTQRCWDGFVAHAIEERSQALAKRFADLRIDYEASAIAQRLRAHYEEEYASTWRVLPGMVHLTPRRTLDAVVARLGELGHEGSPYRALVVAWLHHKTLKSGVADKAAAELKPAAPEEEAKKLAWLDQALNAVGILHASLASYASTCPVDARLANLAEHGKAVAACSAFLVNAETALAAYPEDEPRQAFISHVRLLAEEARIVLERELLIEAVKAAPGFHLAMTAGDLQRRLDSVGVPEFSQLWRDLIRGFAVAPAGDAAASAARLNHLASPQSPLAALLRAAWRGQKLKPQLIAAQGGVTVDTQWIDHCFKALGTLAAAYAPAIAPEPGPRVARLSVLKTLAETFAMSEREVGAALASIADDEFRSSVMKPLVQLQEDARRHLFTLLAADADQLWNERVRLRFARECAPAFPFATASAENADPKLVAAFLAPKTGSLWETERLLAAVSQITIAGQPLIRCDAACQRALASARAVSGALFASDSDTLLLSFTAELRQCAGVFQAVVALGKEQLDLFDNPLGKRTFTCSLAEPQGCRIAIQLANGHWLEAVSEPQPWGLLRWAQGGNPVPDGNGHALCTWTLTDADAPPSAKLWQIQLAIDDGPVTALLSRRLFTDLSFPATVTVKGQER